MELDLVQGSQQWFSGVSGWAKGHAPALPSGWVLAGWDTQDALRVTPAFLAPGMSLLA